MWLSEVHIYPIKSARGLTLADAVAQPWGLEHDRRWMVIDPDGGPITARADQAMFTITATPTGDESLQLTAPGQPDLLVKPPVDGEPKTLAWPPVDAVRDAGDEAGDWIAGVLGKPARLLWLADPTARKIGADHGGLPDDVVNLADTGPVLLTTTASLARLNDWIDETRLELGEPPAERLLMERFRPNVVVEDVTEAFIEDRWKTVRIGEVNFRATELCDRCVMPTIDPDTLVGGKEPTRTLAKHRRWDGAVWFGLRLVPVSAGTVRVQDEVSATV